MLDTVIRALSMAGMLFNICTQSAETVKLCMTDQHIWLYPEIRRAWDLYTRRELPYSSEGVILEVPRHTSGQGN